MLWSQIQFNKKAKTKLWVLMYNLRIKQNDTKLIYQFTTTRIDITSQYSNAKIKIKQCDQSTSTLKHPNKYA